MERGRQRTQTSKRANCPAEKGHGDGNGGAIAIRRRWGVSLAVAVAYLYGRRLGLPPIAVAVAVL
jgi:hypothetical protein